ncbi:MAG: hypothetical protein ACREBD_14370 [Blastocatellia bacterium]
MQSWKPDRLLKAILIWTVVTAGAVWLPLIRGLMDGSTYQWGGEIWGFKVGGSGVGGDYWLLPLQAGFVLWLLYLGWRGAKQPFHWLLLLWHIPLGASAIYNSLRFPENYRFRGDTLGVDISLAWVGPLLFGGFALLSLIWVARDLRRNQPRAIMPLQHTNRILLTLTLSLLPVQFALLRFGEPHGTTDKIGVLLTMLQWVGLNVAFASRGSNKAEVNHA